MQLHQLDQFLEICRRRSVRAAAESLYLSAPALSRNLAKLEGELGCRLFDRTSSGMAVTPYGEIVLAHASAISQEIEEMHAELALQKRADSQVIRCGCYSEIFNVYGITELSAALDGISLEAYVDDTEALSEGLSNGSYDVAFSVRELGLRATCLPIVEELLLVSVPASSKLSRRESVSLRDIARHRFIIPADLRAYTGWYKRVLQEAGVQSDRVRQMPMQDYLKTADRDASLHFISTFVANHTAASTSRTLVPLTGDAASRTVYASWVEGNRAKVQPLVDYLKNTKHLFSGSVFLSYLLGTREQMFLES